MPDAAATNVDIPGTLDEAFREVIEMMFGMGIEGPIEDPDAAELSVAGMIGLAGTEFHGLLQITCSAGSSRALAAALLGGEDMLDDPSIIGDSLGELANMLGGAVKQRIDVSGVRVEISLPSVLEGEFSLTGVGAEESVNHHYLVDGKLVRVGLVYNSGPAAD